jgi:hypothetical protein
MTGLEEFGMLQESSQTSYASNGVETDTWSSSLQGVVAQAIAIRDSSGQLTSETKTKGAYS